MNMHPRPKSLVFLCLEVHILVSHLQGIKERKIERKEKRKTKKKRKEKKREGEERKRSNERNKNKEKKES